MVWALGLVTIVVVWGLGRAIRRKRALLRHSSAPRGPLPSLDLDGLLRQFERPSESKPARPELAAVRGRTPRREHVWCAPGGEEVFLN